jgi:hypothetical protein
MKAKPSKSNLSDILNILSENILPDEVRPRIKKLFDEMDQLLFLDETHELAVDRKTLIRLVNNEDLMPTSLRDITLVETSKYLGRRLKELRKGRRIKWRDGEKYGLPIHVLSEKDLRNWGITDRTSTNELADIMKMQFPEIPEFWMNDNSKQLADEVLQNFMVNRTVWDCLVANMGWWAALTLAGGLVVFLVLLGSGVPWPAALLIAGIYQSVATTYFLLQCAANPYFQQ